MVLSMECPDQILVVAGMTKHTQMDVAYRRHRSRCFYPKNLVLNLGCFVAPQAKDEPSFDAVFAALPPILSGWGTKENFGYAGQHTFTSSRHANVDG